MNFARFWIEYLMYIYGITTPSHKGKGRFTSQRTTPEMTIGSTTLKSTALYDTTTPHDQNEIPTSNTADNDEKLTSGKIGTTRYETTTSEIATTYETTSYEDTAEATGATSRPGLITSHLKRETSVDSTTSQYWTSLPPTESEDVTTENTHPSTTASTTTTTTRRTTTTLSQVVQAAGSKGKQSSKTDSEAGGQYCSSREIERFYCEHGCCGDYREQHCCSFAGLVVGIIIGVALLIAVIAGIVYCWLKKKWRQNNQQVGFSRGNHNCNGANVTVLHQSSTMAITTTGNSAAPAPMFPAYAAPYGPPYPPPYSAALAPTGAPPKESPPPYCQQPPPYSLRPNQRTTVHGIGSSDPRSNRRTTRDRVNRAGPAPVS